MNVMSFRNPLVYFLVVRPNGNYRQGNSPVETNRRRRDPIADHTSYSLSG